MWTILLIFGLALGQETTTNAPEPEVVEAAPDAAIRMIWTGGLDGIGSGAYAFSLHESMDAERLRSIEPEHGWMVQDSWALRALDGRVASLNRAFAEKPDCTREESLQVYTIPTEHLGFSELPAGWTVPDGARLRELQAWSCGDSVQLLRFGASEAPLPGWDSSQWEVRQGLRWNLTDGQTFHTLGVPQDEGTRRVTALQAGVDSGRLFVDAGGFVDGASAVKEGSLSLHRPTGFASLRRLKPAALVPGETELVAGAENLLREAGGLPYVVANWSAASEGLSMRGSRVVVDEGSGLKVGFVGVLEPSLAARIPILDDEGISISDPVLGVQRAVAAWDEPGADRPDVVVVIGELSPETIRRIQEDIPEVHLVIGSTAHDLSGQGEVRFAFAEPGAWRAASAVSLPLDGVVEGELSVMADGAELQPTRMSYRPVEVTPALRPDPETLAAVTQVRLSTYPALEGSLLHQPTPVVIGKDDFAKAVCEAVLAETKADLVLLPALGQPSAPGSMSELQVAGRLALPDRLEVHRVPGDRFSKLLDQLVGMVPHTCGAPLAQSFPKARGRSIEAERMYRVVTTDRVRERSAGLEALLKTAHGKLGVLDRAAMHPVVDASGQEQTLRGTAVAGLRRMRSEYGKELLSELVARDSKRYDPQWLVRVRQVGIDAVGFDGVGDDAYALIPETLATSPSSLTLGFVGDVALDYSERRVRWDLRARLNYARLRTEDGVQESADDVKLSSSITLPMLALPAVGGVELRPFSEAMFDSEFTPLEEDGQLLPRQGDMYLTAGLATGVRPVLRAFRLGAFGLVDAARPEKQPELGMSVHMETRTVFGPRLRWVNTVDGFYYGSTPDDDRTDLRFKAQWDSQLELPLARWLNVSMFSTAFAFAGRVPETSNPAASFTLGARMHMGGIVDL